ncbi:low molecular weight phosphotyrosine protein phosphatase [Lacrimispora sp. NSJ-141]|uniref:protein-tyrosine-phosphatase n=1 Tax=Lientehia hominis TaxID=2897778 RepID=A0AAP2W952_9FIRM|nr:low molecular weight protein-tyrosine-phosphatase [Lientehia hominis]MCD2492955.1 low molecular weight phosphotyrosine protein phosphatase [Lientehia hominis]
MIKVLFICHGNICRSPMAEYVLKDMVRKRGLEDCFEIESAATSYEEIGNPVHRGTRSKLRSCGIPAGDHRAVRMKKTDYDKYDYLIGMEQRNISNMFRILGMRPEEDTEHKVRRLLDFGSRPRDIADPWYTGNFDLTYEDILEGCEAFLKYVL